MDAIYYIEQAQELLDRASESATGRQAQYIQRAIENLNDAVNTDPSDNEPEEY